MPCSIFGLMPEDKSFRTMFLTRILFWMVWGVSACWLFRFLVVLLSYILYRYFDNLGQQSEIFTHVSTFATTEGGRIWCPPLKADQIECLEVTLPAVLVGLLQHPDLKLLFLYQKPGTKKLFYKGICLAFSSSNFWLILKQFETVIYLFSVCRGTWQRADFFTKTYFQS